MFNDQESLSKITVHYDNNLCIEVEHSEHIHLWYNGYRYLVWGFPRMCSSYRHRFKWEIEQPQSYIDVWH